MTNEAFEKWLKENYLVDMSEFIVDEQERTYIKENNLLRKAWQAARADSEQEIAELKAHINDLREALERINDGAKGIAMSYIHKQCKEALLKTPAQSLQEFENEVIERCAKVLEQMELIAGWILQKLSAH